MTQDAPADVIRIRKYANRRYYDSSRSKHLKLEELYHLVRDGHQIQVIDGDGNDITNVVLAQLLLEHDPLKFDLFPASLLHQTIQANQELVRRFIDQYFSKALDTFLASKQQFDQFLTQAGLSPLQPLTPFDWARRFLLGMNGGRSEPMAAAETPEPSTTERPNDPSIDMLRSEIETLRHELERLRDEASEKRAEPAKATAGGKNNASARKTTRR